MENFIELLWFVGESMEVFIVESTPSNITTPKSSSQRQWVAILGASVLTGLIALGTAFLTIKNAKEMQSEKIEFDKQMQNDRFSFEKKVFRAEKLELISQALADADKIASRSFYIDLKMMNLDDSSKWIEVDSPLYDAAMIAKLYFPELTQSLLEHQKIFGSIHSYAMQFLTKKVSEDKISPLDAAEQLVTDDGYKNLRNNFVDNGQPLKNTISSIAESFEFS